jgi:hypothetical protein
MRRFLERSGVRDREREGRGRRGERRERGKKGGEERG